MSLDWNVVKGPARATHPLSWHSESDGGQHTHRTGPPRHQICCCPGLWLIPPDPDHIIVFSSGTVNSTILAPYKEFSKIGRHPGTVHFKTECGYIGTVLNWFFSSWIRSGPHPDSQCLFCIWIYKVWGPTGPHLGWTFHINYAEPWRILRKERKKCEFAQYFLRMTITHKSESESARIRDKTKAAKKNGILHMSCTITLLGKGLKYLDFNL